MKHQICKIDAFHKRGISSVSVALVLLSLIACTNVEVDTVDEFSFVVKSDVNINEVTIAASQPIPFPTLTESQQKELDKLLGPPVNIDTIPEGVARRADVDAIPFRVAGKLLIRWKDGSGGHCTAQFATDRKLVLTAAHCVLDERTNYKESADILIFQVASPDGKFLRNYFVSMGKVHPEFISDQSINRFRYDYAWLCSIDKSKTGAFALEGNTRSRTWTSIGYPRNFSEGKHMYRVAGIRGKGLAGIVEMNGNPFSKGSSGGAMIDGLESKNAVVSINSFTSDNRPNAMFGPLLDNRARSLRNRALAECR